MNYALVFYYIGRAILIQAGFMFISFLVAVGYSGDDKIAFALSLLIVCTSGIALSFIKPKDKKLQPRDAFAIAALSWFVFSIFGALPFHFSGHFNSFADCVFESTSGFTTTGATILAEIESLPKGILFWRSFAHWIGGMGVLVFMVAVMQSSDGSAINIIRAESTGLSPDRMVPSIRKTAMITYAIYTAMTVILVILLLISGLPLYDSLVHSFSTAGTGGLSNMNASVGAYNNVAAEIIMTVFMFLFGVNFTLYYYLIKKRFKDVLQDEELRFYFIIVAVAIIIITMNISGLYDSVWEALRYSSFQVSTVISSTGFSTADFNYWPALSHAILVLLMLTGCSQGSTGGGVKLVRILVLFKAAKVEVNKILHPRSVKAITLNGEKIDSDAVRKTALFFFIYIAALVFAVLLVSIEGKELISSIVAVISMLSNIGPGLGSSGTSQAFSVYTGFSKYVFSFCMIAGRLEFFPVMILLMPSAWRRKSI